MDTMQSTILFFIVLIGLAELVCAIVSKWDEAGKLIDWILGKGK